MMPHIGYARTDVLHLMGHDADRGGGAGGCFRIEAQPDRSCPVLMFAGYDAAVLAYSLQIMTCANPALLASGTFLVTEGRQRIMSRGGFTFEAPGGGATTPVLAHLRHFAVDPACVCRGVGRAVFERCATMSSPQARRLQA